MLAESGSARIIKVTVTPKTSRKDCTLLCILGLLVVSIYEGNHL